MNGDVGAKLQKQLKQMLYLTVATFVLLMATIGYAVKTNYDLGVQGKQAHTAVCALRADLDKRVRATEAYLATHPGDILGIPREQVLSSLENQKATLRALATAGCD